MSFFTFLPVNHFTFEIVEGNEERKFRIDPLARTILVNQPLDYDYPVMDRNVSRLVVVTSLRVVELTQLPCTLGVRNSFPAVLSRHCSNFSLGPAG